MDQTCLLDVDGVLADFVAGACEVHNAEYPYTHPQNMGIYEMEGLIGLTSIEFMAPMSKDFWAGLKPTQDAHEIVKMVESKFGPENVALLTKPVPTPGCLEGKELWIRHHFPQFLNRFLIGSARKSFCAHENSVLIDDHEKNVKEFADAGGRGFLMPAPWNWKYNLPRLGELQAFLGSL